MKTGYIDTSCLIALLFGEADSVPVRQIVAVYESRIVSSLVEAEVLAVAARNGVVAPPDWHQGLRFLRPPARLTEQLQQVLSSGYVRGADAWHIACALYAAPSPGQLDFLTLDTRQAVVARAIGFPTPLQDAPRP